MLKNKVLVIIVLGLFIPQVTFAVWWNPFSWNIFQKNTTTSHIIIPSDDKDLPFKLEPTNSKEVKVKQNNVATHKSKPTETKQDITVEQNIIFCNGVNWSQCPSGQNFVCPQKGEAYCQTLEQKNQVPINQIQTVDSQFLNNLSQIYKEETESKIANLNKSTEDYNSKLIPIKTKIDELTSQHSIDCPLGQLWRGTQEIICRQQNTDIINLQNQVKILQQEYASQNGFATQSASDFSKTLNYGGSYYTFYYNSNTGSGSLYNNNNPAEAPTKIYCSTGQCNIYGSR